MKSKTHVLSGIAIICAASIAGMIFPAKNCRAQTAAPTVVTADTNPPPASVEERLTKEQFIEMGKTNLSGAFLRWHNQQMAGRTELALSLGHLAGNRGVPWSEKSNLVSIISDDSSNGTQRLREWLESTRLLEVTNGYHFVTLVTNEVYLTRRFVERVEQTVSNVVQVSWWKAENGQWMTNIDLMRRTVVSTPTTNVVEVK